MQTKAEEEEEQRDADAHLHEAIFTLLKQANSLVPVWYWIRPRDFSARRVDAELTLSPCRCAIRLRMCVLDGLLTPPDIVREPPGLLT